VLAGKSAGPRSGHRLPALARPPDASNCHVRTLGGRDFWLVLGAALLGAALGIMRPVRREIIPRSPHVIQEKIRKLSKLIKKLNGRNGTSVDWEIKRYKTVRS